MSTHSRRQDLMDNEETRAIREKYVHGLMTNPQFHQALQTSLREVAPFAPNTFTEQVLTAIDEDRAEL